MSNSYTNINIYYLVKAGVSLPADLLAKLKAEGANYGTLKDGRTWIKDCFASPSRLRAAVHAEDVGKLVLKTAEEMQLIFSAET